MSQESGALTKPPVEAPSRNTRILRSALGQALGELDLLYSLEPKLKAEPNGRARLTKLLGVLARHLGMSYCVLLVPSRKLRIAVTHSNWDDVNRKQIDDRLLNDVLPRYEYIVSPQLLEVPQVPPNAKGPDGRYQLLVQPIHGQEGEAVGVLALMCQTRSRPLTQIAQRLVMHFSQVALRVIDESFDPVTGFMRRADFKSLLKRVSARAALGEEQWSAAYFDLRFSEGGDPVASELAQERVLKRFAALLEAQADQTTVLARVSNDKFAVLLEDQDLEQAATFADAALARCEQEVLGEGDDVGVSVMRGVVALSDPRLQEHDPLALIQRSCIAANANEDIMTSSVEPQTQQLDRRVLRELQAALRAQRIELEAQPIMPISGQSSAPHYEVFARLRASDGDVMAPKAFVTAAEAHRLMPQLDRLVLSRFFESIAESEMSLAMHEATFSINLSRQTLEDESFVAFVRELLFSSPLTPTQLCFEISEAALDCTAPGHSKVVAELRDIGCRFALDDFGTVITSYSQLQDLQVDIIKIDGSFTRQLSKNGVVSAAVGAIVNMADQLGLVTIAEYVETVDALAGLRDLGIGYGQGFLLGKPESLGSKLGALSAHPMTAQLLDSIVPRSSDFSMAAGMAH
ncbi:MAG: GGDEF domain-containing phosphodiesterase [Pseudomonadota bacterium]